MNGAATPRARGPRLSDVSAIGALRHAWDRVRLNRGGAGADGVTVWQFEERAGRNVASLAVSLRRRTYEPVPPRLFAAPKRSGGVRPISILSVRDRVVQQALHGVWQPIIEPACPPCSFAYRPGVSAIHAAAAVEGAIRDGRRWFAETDIASFFDTIDHERLMRMLRRFAPDEDMVALLSRCLAACQSCPGAGIGQGAATSPLFSNLYLADFDAEQLRQGRRLVRYGDDMVVACRTRGEAQRAIADIEAHLRGALGLSLKPDKTRVTAVEEGFTFLGFRFTERGRQAAPDAVLRLEQRMAEATPDRGPAILRGWSNYFGCDQTPSVHSAPVIAAKVEAPRVQSNGTTAALRAFLGRPDIHARVTATDDGRRRFVPCSGPVSETALADHAAGRCSIATYLVGDDGSTRIAVADIDSLAAERANEALEAARRVAEAAGAMALAVAVEATGGRGAHVWFRFEEPIRADDARRLARLVTANAGIAGAGMRIEILPRQPRWSGPDLGDAVTLPLGLHPTTGKRSELVSGSADSLMPAAAAASALAGLSRQAGNAAPVSGEGRLPCEIRHCSVIAALAKRAAATGTLAHTHRLVLLYTLGRLGRDGLAAMHRILSHCDNYNAELCDRYAGGLDVHHAPITCNRIREWLDETGDEGECGGCDGRRTPIDSGDAPTRKVRPSAQAQAPATPSEADWAAVAGELWGDTGGSEA